VQGAGFIDSAWLVEIEADAVVGLSSTRYDVNEGSKPTQTSKSAAGYI
jgi:hypothetical protein